MAFTFLFMAVCAVACGANKTFTLVIDAGHGGHDVGAQGAKSQEKNINLSVALAFGRYVEQNCSDVKVVYTRKTDVFVPLHDRAAIANKNNADLFISIHTNAVPVGHEVQGFQTYTLGMHRAKDNLDVAKRENSVISMEKDYKQTYQGFDPNSAESYIMFEFMQSANMHKSVELAKTIQRSVCSNVGRQDKGVHQAGFLVLRETTMPGCLIELGFITTPAEEDFLDSDSGVDAMAQAIYRAFLEYKSKYADGTTVPYQMQQGVRVQPLAQSDSDTDDSVQPSAQRKQVRSRVTTPASATATAEKKAQQKVAEAPAKVQTRKAQAPDKAQADRASERAKSANAKAKGSEASTKKEVAERAKSANAKAKGSEASTKKEMAERAKSANAKAKGSEASTKKEAAVAKKAPAKGEKAEKATDKKADAKKERTASAKQKDKEEKGGTTVFKVQIFSTPKQLKADDARLKHYKAVSYYREGNMYKYTAGSSANYHEISALRKRLAAEYPDAFVVAFKNGKKVNTNDAIREFKSKK